MAPTSYSNTSRRHKTFPPVAPADLWMVVASVLLAVAYLSIRSRISNYTHVVRWMVGFFQSFIGV